MSDSIELKQYDTARPIEQTLEIDGQPLALAGTTVHLLLRKLPGGPVRELAAELVPAIAGGVRYQPAPADVAEAGAFEAEWRITYPDGRPLRVPTRNRLPLTIHPALAAP
jgi:hypothetical protein